MTTTMTADEWRKKRPTARAAVRVPGQMNKLEARYAKRLTLDPNVAAWWFESVTLKLGPDCRYTPDFKVQLVDGTIEYHEVKGFRRDDGMVKIRVAAGQHPERFWLVEAGKGEAWERTEVK